MEVGDTRTRLLQVRTININRIIKGRTFFSFRRIERGPPEQQKRGGGGIRLGRTLLRQRMSHLPSDCNRMTQSLWHRARKAQFPKPYLWALSHFPVEGDSHSYFRAKSDRSVVSANLVRFCDFALPALRVAASPCCPS